MRSKPLPIELNESSCGSGAARATRSCTGSTRSVDSSRCPASIVRQLLWGSLRSLLLSYLALAVSTNCLLADDWFDAFFQYRIPFETNSKHDGWMQIPLSPEQITNAVNQSGRFPVDSRYFAFNAVALVEVDAAGNVVDSHPEAGFYLTPIGTWPKVGKTRRLTGMPSRS